MERNTRKTASMKNAQNKKQSRSGEEKRKGGATSKAVDEPYVVVITNVENDFSKIHQSCLPSYFGLDPNRSRNEDRGSDSAEDQCVYSIKCRTETRSAEITISGSASAPVSSVFSGYSKKKEKGSSENTTASDPTAVETSESSDFTEDAKQTDLLAARVASLQHQPYFRYHLRFDTHIPGKPAQSVLHSGYRKRQRDDKDSEPRCIEVKQCLHTQQDLVTAVAAVSASWTNTELRQHLKDLPGFMACWKLYSRHFRVVFENKGALFRAKQLLDEFEIEGKVRVTLQLSDAYQRQYEESLVTEHANWHEAPLLESVS